MAEQKNNDCEMNGEEDFTQDVETTEQMNGNSENSQQNQDESQNGNHFEHNGGRDDDR